jgi:hypothetical protein
LKHKQCGTAIPNRYTKGKDKHNPANLLPSPLDGSAVGSILGRAFEFDSTAFVALIPSFK